VSLAGGLAQCPVLDQLYLGYNDIGTVGKGRLRASWYGRASALWLEDEEDVEEEEEKE
jgi:hypothetical protein